MRSICSWLHQRAENVLAAMLLVMFCAFLLQILFRYVLNLPVGWTNELSSVLWIWIVLFGAAFVLRENEEIRFDLFYLAVGSRARRVMTIVFSVALLLLYVGSFPAVYDYVTFMKVEKSAYLKLRFDWLFSIYLLFVIAVVVRYFFLGWQAMRGTGAFSPEAALETTPETTPRITSGADGR